MKKTKILLNITCGETRAAVLEDGKLQAVQLERVVDRGVVGNIYKARVSKVLPGMQAAFVDYGDSRAGFLHVSDAVARSESADGDLPPIKTIVQEGQEIIVQVIKDKIADKGARLTTQLTIPAHHLVLIPQQEHIGVSHRIDDEAERERLTALVNDLTTDELKGFIVRTAAIGAQADELKQDVRLLQQLWHETEECIRTAKIGELVFEDLPLGLRVIRDTPAESLEAVYVDSSAFFQQAQEFVRTYIPEVVGKLHEYADNEGLFESFRVERDINIALSRRVNLPSGGYIIIEPTEAMVTIDVNTGGYVGDSDAEQTLYKTNMEAVDVIAHQLRLRNVGGIVILDFIDMELEEHKHAVVSRLTELLDEDPTKTTVSEMSELGLVELTRKRSHKSLTRQIFEPCKVCKGRGLVRRLETICYELLRSVLNQAAAIEGDTITIKAAPVVVDYIVENDAKALEQVLAGLGKVVKYEKEDLFVKEHYDVITS